MVGGGGNGWLGKKNENGHVGKKNEKKEKRGKRKSPLDRLKTLKNGVKRIYNTSTFPP